ncbi:hypothetical protein Celaphus_00013031, partial [Cervus elaphus hippelaphus]
MRLLTQAGRHGPPFTCQTTSCFSCSQMIFPALVFLGLKNNDCCGCCGNEGCGKRFALTVHKGSGLQRTSSATWKPRQQPQPPCTRGEHSLTAPAPPHTSARGFRTPSGGGRAGAGPHLIRLQSLMFTSTIFAVIGVLGAGYSFIVSAVSINRGPKCLISQNNTWGYPFHEGDYLGNSDLWSRCQKPSDVVPWNLTLFSILLIVGAVQIIICAIQVINGLLGTLCGDCQCCGCCGEVDICCRKTHHGLFPNVLFPNSIYTSSSISGRHRN